MVEMLMRAATRVLIRDGYEALTTNRVAEAAGASVGSLYQYFSGKQQLVAALLSQHVERTMQQFRQAVPELMHAPPQRAARRFVELAVASHRIEPELHRVFFEQLPRVSDFAQLEAALNEGLTLVEAYLRAHAHEITPQDHALTAFLVVNTVESLTHSAVLTRPDLLSSDAFVDEVTQVVLGYLRPLPAVASATRAEAGRRRSQPRKASP